MSGKPFRHAIQRACLGGNLPTAFCLFDLTGVPPLCRGLPPLSSQVTLNSGIRHGQYISSCMAHVGGAMLSVIRCMRAGEWVLHLFFDADYYRRQIALPLDDAMAMEHFLAEGDARGLDPCAYFSTRFYKAQYPDWHLHAATALEDFLRALPQDADRRPHPLIDPSCYRALYPDLANLGPDATRHFIHHGDAEGRSPSQAFDASFYRRCYLPLGAGYPFRHYVTVGAAEGHLPRPLPRDAMVSAAAMRQAVGKLACPFVMLAHDAQAAGVPILTLDLARAVRSRGYDPVFLLRNAGPLLAQFREIGPVFLLAEGWDAAGLAAGLPPGTVCIVNTAAMAGVAPTLAQGDLHGVLLLHEMADYIREQGFLADLRATRDAGMEIIASMPQSAAALANDLGRMDHLIPGILPPYTSLAAFRNARAWANACAAPVFIGAGYADRRKGFDLFLAAAFRIAGLRADARFVWLGALDDWARALADTALAQGLNLTLPGFVSDCLAWYRAADVYLLTSRQDPGPTTAIHAAAVGTPFVGYAADIGLIGLAERAGKFVEPGDEEAFVAAALNLAGGVDTRSRRALRRHVRAMTSFDRYVDAILSRLAPAAGGAA